MSLTTYLYHKPDKLLLSLCTVTRAPTFIYGMNPKNSVWVTRMRLLSHWQVDLTTVGYICQWDNYWVFRKYTSSRDIGVDSTHHKTHLYMRGMKYTLRLLINVCETIVSCAKRMKYHLDMNHDAQFGSIFFLFFFFIILLNYTLAYICLNKITQMHNGFFFFFLRNKPTHKGEERGFIHLISILAI